MCAAVAACNCSQAEQHVSSCRPSAPCLVTSLLTCVLLLLPATHAEVNTLMQMLEQDGLVMLNTSYRAQQMQLPGTHARTLNSGSVRMRSQAPRPCFLTPERSAFSSVGSQTLYSLQHRVKWRECVQTLVGWSHVTLSQVACTQSCNCCIRSILDDCNNL